MNPSLPLIKPGTRTIIAGKTGCGKTTLAKYLMLMRSVQHWVIFNPKHTVGYRDMPNSVTLHKWDAGKFANAMKNYRFVILNFTLAETNAEFMDSVLLWIHDNYENIGICCDELYYMHDGGDAGNGLVALLTRGRERKQTFIGLTQRPRNVSLFCFTESDNIIMMQLNLKDDRKRMMDVSGNESFLTPIAKRHWRWYEVDDDSSVLWGPLPRA